MTLESEEGTCMKRRDWDGELSDGLVFDNLEYDQNVIERCTSLSGREIFTTDGLNDVSQGQEQTQALVMIVYPTSIALTSQYIALTSQ